MTPDLQSLLDQYLRGLPPGRYHRRDDAPLTVFREGFGFLTFLSSELSDAQAGSIVSALVLLLNERGE